MSYRFPFPPYADGWFQVAYSDELEAGTVMPVKYFGREMVLFRGADGEAHLLDAYCPHLGAHLGRGGRVEGNSVVCPFHAWAFDGSGRCTKIPYADKIPGKARVEAYPVCERNGLIMMWHHGQGAPPAWEVPALPQFGNDEWSEWRQRRWIINTHNQEMGENSVDCAHFQYLHGTVDMPDTEVKSMDGHVFHAFSTSRAKAFGNIVESLIDVRMHGFGFTTTHFTGIVEVMLVNSSTPIDDQSCDFRFSFTVKKMGDDGMTNLVGDKFIEEIARQLEADIPIWENKVYLDKPLVVSGDGPINQYRNWVKQFYTMDWPPQPAA